MLVAELIQCSSGRCLDLIPHKSTIRTQILIVYDFDGMNGKFDRAVILSTADPPRPPKFTQNYGWVCISHCSLWSAQATIGKVSIPTNSFAPPPSLCLSHYPLKI